MTETVTYRIFGILLWSVTRTVPPPPEIDTDRLYLEFSERFEREHKEAWAKDLAQQLSEAVAKLRQPGGSR